MSPHVAVLADIHGNLPALEAVLADAGPVDLYLIAGDLVSGAPYAREIIDLIRPLKAVVIRGNRDQYLLDYHHGRSGQDYQKGSLWGMLRWTYRALGEDGLRYLETLPGQAVAALPGCDSIRVVHGSPDGSGKGLVPDEDPAALAAFVRSGLWPADRPVPPLAHALEGIGEPVLVCAHTHIPWSQRVGVSRPGGGRLALNPGSTGQPVNSDPRAQYAILHASGGGWEVEHRRLVYDTGRVRQAYLESGLLEEGSAFARASLANILTGENVTWRLVQLAGSFAREAGTGGEITEWAVERASQCIDWHSYGVGEG